jgi:hypothetical protein
MIKEGDPPVSNDLLEEARRNLDRDYGFALGEEDGRTVLFVRAPESKPDPFHSLEVVSFSVAEDDLAGVRDVLLVGDDRIVRVEPSTLADLVEERRDEDPEVAKHLRNRLDRDHDYTVFRHTGARDHLRLGVRVPRDRVDDLEPEDQEALGEALSPILSSPKGKQIRAYYVIGDEHARRVSRDELVDLVGEPLAEAVEAQPDMDPPEDDEEPEIDTEPPSSPDKVGSERTGPTPGNPGAPSPGSTGDGGAEIIDADGSGGAEPDPAEDASSPDPPGQQAPGANVDPDGPGSTIDDSDPDGDGTGAEWLGSGDETGSGADAPQPEPDETSGASPSPEADSSPTTSEPEPAEDPSTSSPSTSGSPPSSEGASASSGGADTPSPEDEGIAGLAGRGSRFDRPDPEGADEPSDGDDDIVTADVEQAPGGEVPAPDEAQPQGAAPGAEPTPQDPPQSGAAAPEAGADPADTAGATPEPTPDASTQPAAGEPAEDDLPPEQAAAQRLREAGYEVVEGVEAGGQPFDFAADRSGGKRLLGLAVPSLGPEEVEALAEAGRQADAAAVLAVPHDVEPGAREAAWGTRVDLVPPRAAAQLEL